MRLPAYGRDLIELQRSGANVAWLVLSLGWDYGRALPRLVVPDDAPVGELDLSMLDGIECMVAHAGKEGRALDVADLALRSGAKACCVFDMARGALTFTSDDVRAIRGRAAA